MQVKVPIEQVRALDVGGDLKSDGSRQGSKKRKKPNQTTTHKNLLNSKRNLLAPTLMVDLAAFNSSIPPHIQTERTNSKLFDPHLHNKLSARRMEHKKSK